MRILVTGGTGFVGSHVARQLQATGHAVRLLVRDQTKACAYYDKLNLPQPEMVTGDITEADSVAAALAECNAVVHAAAGTPLGATRNELLRVNVEGTRNVVGTALEQGIQQIVCVSSITAIFNEDGAKVTANAPPAPSKLPYGQSKVEAERYLRSLQASGAAISIVYPGGVVGPDDPSLSDSMRALKHRIDNGFRIFGDGGMQQVDVRDLAAFICSLAVKGEGGRFLVPGVYLKWTEFADIVESVSGCDLKRIPVEGWKLRLMGRLIDIVRKFRVMDTPISAETMRYATLWPRIENTHELVARGITLRDPAQTFSDCIAWMVAEKHLDGDQCPRIVRTPGLL